MLKWFDCWFAKLKLCVAAKSHPITKRRVNDDKLSNQVECYYKLFHKTHLIVELKKNTSR